MMVIERILQIEREQHSASPAVQHAENKIGHPKRRLVSFLIEKTSHFLSVFVR